MSDTATKGSTEEAMMETTKSIQYVKIRFVSKYHHGATAGLVWTRHELEGKTIEDISRRYPRSEFRKMDRLERSPVFDTWEEAFSYEFK